MGECVVEILTVVVVDAVIADSKRVCRSMDSRSEHSDMSLSSTTGIGTMCDDVVVVVCVTRSVDGTVGMDEMIDVSDSRMCLFLETLGVSNAWDLSQNVCFRETQIV